MPMHLRCIFLLVFLLPVHFSLGQTTGIKGFIQDKEGQPLPYATVYIRNLKTGSSANAEGFYSIGLEAGRYDLVFQFLGYQTRVISVDIKTHWETLDVKLDPIVYQLQSVSVLGGKEDPSYTVIRKAIAKADYHLNQLDAYTARVYIKGSGRLLDSPILLRKLVEKEGIDSNMAFVSETEIEATFRRPNHYEQRVISMRESGSDNDASPNEFIFGTFYDSKLGDAVSPLSPKAFAYYRFKYEGFFIDQGYTVNKIKVTPRTKGDNLFEGYLYILEDYWSIYKVDLNVYSYGIKFGVQQNYSPIEENIWMPVHFKVEVHGKFFGFEFEYDYLATVSDYKVTINPDLDYSIEIIDEKIEAEVAEKLEKENKVLDEVLQQGTDQELTRKQLRELMKTYEEEALKAEDDEFVVYHSNTTIDSMATRRDSAYWTQIRTVPLNHYEIRGYGVLDSLNAVQKEKDTKDSLKAHGKFRWYDVVLGGSIKLDTHQTISNQSMLELVNFNTVDGLYIGYKLTYNYRFNEAQKLSFSPEVRYAFSREAWNYQFDLSYRYGEGINQGKINLKGGRFTRQFNSNNPIHPINNAFTTLFLESNYLKLFERNYIEALWIEPLSDKFKLTLGASWSERKELVNNTDFTFIKWDSRDYTSNQPQNKELADQTGFPIHQAFVADMSLAYRPWLKFRIRNNKKRPIESSSPTFILAYAKGMAIDPSVVSFDKLSLHLNWRGSIGARGVLGVNFEGGTFLSNERMFFMDYQHFMGNRSPFATNDPATSFRLLRYYDYSTSQNYFNGFVHFQPRKFLLTQFTMLRFAGIKENLFVNYLATKQSENYTEIGYSIDNIFRFFRLEGALAFQNGSFVDSGLRIGISTLFSF